MMETHRRPTASSTLSPAFSVYLDAFRFGAALIVFFDHARNFVIPDVPRVTVLSGREAVFAFFVLSGLVIAYTVDTREADWRTYVTARVARVYPVAIAALLVTLAADALGPMIDPAHQAFLIERVGDFIGPISGSAALRDLTFTNEVWSSHVIFGSNEPYWSLGYEVQYYVLFGLLVFGRDRWRLPLVLVWALLTGPRILCLLPLWLLGVGIWRLVANRRFVARPAAWALVLGAIPVVVAIRLWFGPREEELVPGLYPLAIALCVAMHLFGVASLLDGRPAVDARLAAPVRWLAGGSFTLYLVHQPLLVLASHLVFRASPVAQAAALALVFLIAYAIAEAVERPKQRYVRLVRRLFWPDPAATAAPVRLDRHA